MHSYKPFKMTILLAGLALLNLACPVVPTYSTDFGQLFFNYSFNMKETCIYWLVTESTRIPSEMHINPHLNFRDFGPEGDRVGTFEINSDRRGEPEFKLPIRSLGGSGYDAFIDFDENGTRSDDESLITFDSVNVRFIILTGYGGWGLEPGLYIIRFRNGIFRGDLQSGPVQTVAVTMVDDDLSVTVYKAILRNALLLPWVAVGQGVSTAVVLSNPNPIGVDGFLDFFDLNGNPLDLDINGVTNRQEFEMGPKSSLSFKYEQSGDLKLGYAIGSSTAPIQSSTIYRTEVNGAVYEAGVASPKEASRIHVIPTGLELNTAAAVLNPTNQQADIEVKCTGSNGTEYTNQMSIGPMQAQGNFLYQMCDSPPSVDILQAYLGVSLDVVVTFLNTDETGRQQSSLETATWGDLGFRLFF